MDANEMLELSGKLLDIKFQQKAAKVTMGTSLAVLCITAFSDTKLSRTIHTMAGVTLVGAAIWHSALYSDNFYTKFSKKAINKVKELEAIEV